MISFDACALLKFIKHARDACVEGVATYGAFNPAAADAPCPVATCESVAPMGAPSPTSHAQVGRVASTSDASTDTVRAPAAMGARTAARAPLGVS